MVVLRPALDSQVTRGLEVVLGKVTVSSSDRSRLSKLKFRHDPPYFPIAPPPATVWFWRRDIRCAGGSRGRSDPKPAAFAVRQQDSFQTVVEKACALLGVAPVPESVWGVPPVEEASRRAERQLERVRSTRGLCRCRYLLVLPSGQRPSDRPLPDDVADIMAGGPVPTSPTAHRASPPPSPQPRPWLEGARQGKADKMRAVDELLHPPPPDAVVVNGGLTPAQVLHVRQRLKLRSERAAVGRRGFPQGLRLAVASAPPPPPPPPPEPEVQVSPPPPERRASLLQRPSSAPVGSPRTSSFWRHGVVQPVKLRGVAPPKVAHCLPPPRGPATPVSPGQRAAVSPGQQQTPAPPGPSAHPQFASVSPMPGSLAPRSPEHASPTPLLGSPLLALPPPVRLTNSRKALSPLLRQSPNRPTSARSAASSPRSARSVPTSPTRAELGRMFETPLLPEGGRVSRTNSNSTLPAPQATPRDGQRQGNWTPAGTDDGDAASVIMCASWGTRASGHSRCSGVFGSKDKVGWVQLLRSAGQPAVRRRAAARRQRRLAKKRRDRKLLHGELSFPIALVRKPVALPGEAPVRIDGGLVTQGSLASTSTGELWKVEWSAANRVHARRVLRRSDLGADDRVPASVGGLPLPKQGAFVTDACDEFDAEDLRPTSSIVCLFWADTKAGRLEPCVAHEQPKGSGCHVCGKEPPQDLGVAVPLVDSAVAAAAAVLTLTWVEIADDSGSDSDDELDVSGARQSHVRPRGPPKPDTGSLTRQVVVW